MKNSKKLEKFNEILRGSKKSIITHSLQIYLQVWHDKNRTYFRIADNTYHCDSQYYESKVMEYCKSRKKIIEEGLDVGIVLDNAISHVFTSLVNDYNQETQNFKINLTIFETWKFWKRH